VANASVPDRIVYRADTSNHRVIVYPASYSQKVSISTSLPLMMTTYFSRKVPIVRPSAFWYFAD
jgi:hypothetical protein